MAEAYNTIRRLLGERVAKIWCTCFFGSELSRQHDVQIQLRRPIILCSSEILLGQSLCGLGCMLTRQYTSKKVPAHRSLVLTCAVEQGRWNPSKSNLSRDEHQLAMVPIEEAKERYWPLVVILDADQASMDAFIPTKDTQPTATTLVPPNLVFMTKLLRGHTILLGQPVHFQALSVPGMATMGALLHYRPLSKWSTWEPALRHKAKLPMADLHHLVTDLSGPSTSWSLVQQNVNYALSGVQQLRETLVLRKLVGAFLDVQFQDAKWRSPLHPETGKAKTASELTEQERAAKHAAAADFDFRVESIVDLMTELRRVPLCDALAGPSIHEDSLVLPTSQTRVSFRNRFLGDWFMSFCYLVLGCLTILVLL